MLLQALVPRQLVDRLAQSSEFLRRTSRDGSHMKGLITSGEIYCGDPAELTGDTAKPPTV
jgi:hypothetical protein